MGYTSCNSWKSKADVINEIKRDYNRSGYEILESCSPAKYFAALTKAPDGEKFVLIVLIEQRGGVFYEKTMSHSMGVPCYDIPVSWLDQIEIGEYAIEWAEKVRAFKSTREIERKEAAQKKAALQIGSTITLPANYKSLKLTVVDIQPRKVLAVSCYGTTYRVSKNVLRLSEIS